MWDWIELQLMGCREGEALTIQERCAEIVELAEKAKGAKTPLEFKQYMDRIWVLSYVG